MSCLSNTGGKDFSNIIMWLSINVQQSKQKSLFMNPTYEISAKNENKTILTESEILNHSIQDQISNIESDLVINKSLDINNLKITNAISKNEPYISNPENIDTFIQDSSNKEEFNLKCADQYIENTSSWLPTTDDIIAVLTDSVFKKAKKNSKPPKVDLLECEINDDNPSLMCAIFSFKVSRIDSVNKFFQKNNVKNRFAKYLSSTKNSYNDYAKKVNYYSSDMLFEPKRASKFIDGFLKLYSYKNNNDIKDLEEELQKIDEFPTVATNINEDQQIDDPVNDSNDSSSQEDQVVVNTDQENDMGFGDLFNVDSEIGVILDENQYDGLDVLDFKDPKIGVSKAQQLLKELLNNYSKDAQIKMIAETSYKGAGFKRFLIISWPKAKNSIKVRDLFSKSQFSNLVSFLYKSQNQFDDLNIEVKAIWSLPQKTVGKTPEDVEQYLKTMASYSLSSRKSSWSRLSTQMSDLCESWKEHHKIKTEEDANTKLLADSEILSGIIEPLIEQNMNKSINEIGKSNPESVSEFQDNPKKVITSNDKDNPKNFQQILRKNEIRMNRSWQDVEKNRLANSNYIGSIKPVTDDLPATKNFDAIASTFLSDDEKKRVFIIEGDTGCGKSTQIPQIILKLLLNSDNYDGGMIICTQPRRLSAVSISKRVGQELGEPSYVNVGDPKSLVGYHIGLEPKVSDSNIILFCTTGILIQRLASNPDLLGVSVIIIDEVQERTVETDFLLIVLRKILQRRKDLHLILMSATIDTSLFSRYFDDCPIIRIPGRTFPVDSFYLEDVVLETAYSIDQESEYAINQNFNSGTQIKIEKMKNAKYDSNFIMDQDDTSFNTSQQYSKLNIVEDLSEITNKQDNIDPYYQAFKTIAMMNQNKVNLDLIVHILKFILSDKGNYYTSQIKSKIPESGSILIFLPGIKDINNLASMIESDYDLDVLVPIKLHSAIYTTKPQAGGNSAKKQLDPFAPAPYGKKKVVISTNIAETGITIPDVTIVIDCGRSKQIRYDSRRQMTIMEESYISKASSKQRRGRAGRVQYGLCFCLYTNSQYERLADYDSPEITRFPLHNLCLRIKNQFPEQDLFEFFNSAVDPPPIKSVENAIYSLVGAGALKVHDPKKKPESSELEANKENLDMSLTPLGKQISKFPVDLHVAKMLLYGVIFGCLDPILTVAAALMQSKSIFVQADNDEIKSVQMIYRYGINLDHPTSSLKGEVKDKSKMASFKDLEDTRSHLSDFVYSIYEPDSINDGSWERYSDERKDEAGGYKHDGIEEKCWGVPPARPGGNV
ncbi:ATP-dependent RNA helicase DHX29 [Smittium mucronatum]|uniref:ATP-dependent RNA helicase DHX29 n=1 Tax=Smittium mucronatum TaxID=133383 RepID=A0A1R0H7H5_9FUNG|nr:ATP-dependent RNA helicase DHX29 [Smittium mucronatum]